MSKKEERVCDCDCAFFVEGFCENCGGIAQ